ncbi:hypothetical protein [Lacipirellula sp.]|uniref:hypothetical protein n=1 Tax=Lacipirellula sp. TaxID=2691419 RepID=UPI003D0ED93F
MTDHTSDFTACYVAFVDIMGMKSLVKACETKPEVLQNLISALNEAKNLSPFYGEAKDFASGEELSWQLQVHAFSDSICLFIPVQSRLLSWLLASVRRLHDRLLRQKVLVRGAITISGMYWDKSWVKPPNALTQADPPNIAPQIALGPGLIETYLLEDETAVYPRILMSNRLRSHLEVLYESNAARAFPLANGTLLDYFRQDADGLYHLDVLHPGLIRKDAISSAEEVNEEGHRILRYAFDEISFSEYLELVRHVIELGHAEAKDEKLASKYLWLANYYNEKAKAANCQLIRWFENTCPADAIKLTVGPKHVVE